MRNLPVHWANGMFLRPHHFQAAERYWSEIVQTSEGWDHAYNYGLRSIHLSEEAIANYQVDVAACKARMKDGTIISLETGQEPDRADLRGGVRGLQDALRDLKEEFSAQTVIRVYLAVPKLSLGRPNVAAADRSANHRYVEATLPIPDENEGANDEPISFRAPNISLRLSTDDLTGYELLPIAQIQRAGEGETAPQLDTHYIPPLLSIDAWPPLGRDIIRSIYDQIGQKIETLSAQVKSRGMRMIFRDAADVECLTMLRILNEAYATLRVLTFATGVHPFVAYQELCRIVGALAVFHPERIVPEFPLYDHDDLATVFRWIHQWILDLIFQGIEPPKYEQIPFRGAGRGMRVTLPDRWLAEDWKWFVGVEPEGLTESECQELLAPGKLDWVIASTGEVDWRFVRHAGGVRLQQIAPPRELPPHPGWVFYQVGRDTPAWRDVALTRSLAMRFSEDYIENLDELEGNEELVVAAGRGRKARLRFVLFAVQTGR